MVYQHLNSEERHYIEQSLKSNRSKVEIAEILGRDVSSIRREIKRNISLRGYRYQYADEKAQNRHANKAKAVKMTAKLIGGIETLLGEQWSPEQISGRMTIENNNKQVISVQSIYRYIWRDKKQGGKLYKQLRRGGKAYRKPYGQKKTKEGKYRGIINRVDIDERPDIVNVRGRVGDWEADTIVGKNHKGVIVTLDERVSKLRLAFPLNSKHTQGVCEAINRLLQGFDKIVHTMTFDNGKEFAKHEFIAKELKCSTYFAKPYHSWQRGQNENANGLLRQYFPKAMQLVDIKKQDVLNAVHKLNNRPRKGLGYKTPYEVFFQLTRIKAYSIIDGALMS